MSQIQRFFDWLTAQPEKKSTFASDPAIMASMPVNTFKTQPHSVPAIEIDTADMANVIKSHLNALEEISPSSQNLQEALSIATGSPTILSESQKSSAILSLIGEEDSVFLIRLLRWQNGITCPFCGSKEIKKLPSGHARQYKCQQCEGGDFYGEFDDLTGYFPKGDFHSARIWVLISYLKMFMPLSKIAKVLGISLDQALKVISMMQPPDLSEKKKSAPILTKK